ncbi:MAG: serine hydrolase [Fimbriimonadaceae bacterium]|nr:serine hydrolase [Fimbriimonadaceae bacterium]
MRLAICFALVMSTTATFAQTEKIDALLADFAKPGAPGCAVAITQNGKPIYVKGFGLANLEYNVPVRPDTPFHIASISKQFTAFAIYLLARERKLSLDDDIRRFLPEMHAYAQPVSIRHLIHHTSGVRDQWDLCVLAGWRMTDLITHDDILKLLFRQESLNFTPGSAHLYSNGGYSLLAEIVQRVSGMPFAEFCRKRIFEPLGMSRTQVHESALDIVPGRAQSYFLDGDGKWRNALLSYSNMGATSVFTTVEDFLKWDANFDSHKVGGAAVADWMLQPTVLNNGTKLQYAGGTFVFKYRGLDAVGHAGGDAGFRTDCLRFPQQGLSIILFANRAEASAPSLTRAIADILLEGQFPQPKSTPAKPEVGITLSSSDRDQFVGDYRFENGTIVSIRVVQDSLIGRMDGGEGIPLIARSKSLLFAPLVQTELEMFGDLLAMKMGNRSMVAKRVMLDWPKPSHLAAYAGRYWSDELKVAYEVKVDGDKLVLVHPRENYPLEIRLPDRYVCDLGQIGFSRSRGKVAGFTVSTGRVMGLKFVRDDRKDG